MPNEKPAIYRGRFAPSPTGPVHYGTLIAAVGSYLQARSNGGEWLVRIEDVDILRRVEGADSDILRTLEGFGFEWDGEIIYQSKQTAYYEDVLDELLAQSLIFPCLCSRKDLAESSGPVYPGTCRNRSLPEKHPHALRLIANDVDIEFNDAVMGRHLQNIMQQCGDFIVKRRDGLFAYQLAVVADDALQNITEVVRGADLLDSTPRQIYLQQLLKFSTPGYCHLPLAIDSTGEKLSKSAAAARVDLDDRENLLLSVLQFLGQQPPTELEQTDIKTIWSWALTNWKISSVPATTHMQPKLKQK